MYIRVTVAAGVKRERVARTGPDRYDISVREPAERNRANVRVRELLALAMGVPTGAVRIISGHHSPHKIFSVEQKAE